MILIDFSSSPPRKNASPNAVKVLVGNKCDADQLRVVEQERGAQMAAQMSVPFFECSCKQNINIQAMFIDLCCRINEQVEQNVSCCYCCCCRSLK